MSCCTLVNDGFGHLAICVDDHMTVGSQVAPSTGSKEHTQEFLVIDVPGTGTGSVVFKLKWGELPITPEIYAPCIVTCINLHINDRCWVPCTLATIAGLA